MFSPVVIGDSIIFVSFASPGVTNLYKQRRAFGVTYKLYAPLITFGCSSAAWVTTFDVMNCVSKLVSQSIFRRADQEHKTWKFEIFFSFFSFFLLRHPKICQKFGIQKIFPFLGRRNLPFSHPRIRHCLCYLVINHIWPFHHSRKWKLNLLRVINFTNNIKTVDLNYTDATSLNFWKLLSSTISIFNYFHDTSFSQFS